MTEYQQKLDQIISDGVSTEEAIEQLMQFAIDTGIAPNEHNNYSRECLLAKETLTEALSGDIALHYLPELRVDLELAQKHADRLKMYMDHLYINADFTDSMFYLRPYKPQTLAIRIESAIFARCDSRTEQPYFDCFILLESALVHSENKFLRGGLIFGLIHPAEFVAMSKKELEPETERLKRELALEAILASKDLGRYVVETGIQCTKCGKKTVTRQEKQSRSADEPMSIFYTCSSCGYKWAVN